MTTQGSDPRYDALAELALGTLPEPERQALEQWVASDPQAQAELRAVRETLGALAVIAPRLDPPAHLRDRVIAIAGTSDAGAASTGRGARAMAADRAAPGSPAGWATAGWWLAAASTLLAIGLGVYARQLRDERGQLAAALETTSARLATVEAEVRDSRTRLLRAQAETSILAAPDLRRIDLAGQAPAPRAVARAFWSRAQGLVLTATRLPDLPRGRTYQLWVLTSGAPVSAGLFKGDAAGGASAVFDTPVGLPVPQGLAVSIEPEGGVAAPSGDIILVGKAAN
jgi:anti-sigma-K factor RskA